MCFNKKLKNNNQMFQCLLPRLYIGRNKYNLGQLQSVSFKHRKDQFSKKGQFSLSIEEKQQCPTMSGKMLMLMPSLVY